MQAMPNPHLIVKTQLWLPGVSALTLHNTLLISCINSGKLR
jgi:hypothetical protein